MNRPGQSRAWRVVTLLFTLAPIAALSCLTSFAQTGSSSEELSALDAVMQQALTRYHVNGGALAITRDGRLLFARGYGVANTNAQAPVEPQSVFRWCSISKTITAAAVMRLVEQDKLDLDGPIFDILDQFAPYNGVWGDARLHGITVRQALNHTGGWDRAISSVLDPIVAEGSVRVSQATGASFPPSRDAVIRYMLSQRLDFAPGSRFGYSNFGYMLLGRVVEKISGRSYDSFVRETILSPAGLSQVQKVSAHLSGRLPGEVTYYDYPGAPLVNSYVSPGREMVAAPYGILNPELDDAGGAWAGSVVDLAKFVSMLDGSRSPALLSPQSFHSMVAQSRPATWVDAAGWYGFGLFVQPGQDGLTWDHGGYNPGSKSYFYRFPNGVAIAFIFNGEAVDGNSLGAYAAQAIANVVLSVREWPDIDLFPEFYPPRVRVNGVVNSASFQPDAVAPGSLISIFGTDLGGKGADLYLIARDNSGSERPVSVLASTPDQINSVLPEDSATGPATITVRRTGWPDSTVQFPVTTVAPGLFLINSAGLAAASLVRSRPEQVPSWEEVYAIDSNLRVVPRPIVFGAEDENLTLILYVTGVRGHGGRADVRVQLADNTVSSSYAGPQMEYAGLDQINLELPRALAGAGHVEVRVTAGDTLSNTGFLVFQ